LLPMAGDAMKANDESYLARIFAYAEWCHRQPDHDKVNAVDVGFYETLVEHGAWLWATATTLLPDDLILDVWDLWEPRLSRFQRWRLRRLLRRQNRNLPEILG